MNSQLPDDSRNQLFHEDSPAVPGGRPTVHRLPPQVNGQAIAGLLLGIVSILPGLIFLGCILYLGYRVGIENLALSTAPNPLLDLIGSENLFFLLPIVGMDVAIGGLGASVLGGRKSSRKGIATAGFVLSSIGFVLGLGLPLWWFYLFLGYHV